MSGGRSDCGAEFTAIKSGWTIGLLCGDHRVLAAATDRVAVEQTVEARKNYLFTFYGDEFPACQHIVTVDSEGLVVAKAAPSKVTNKLRGSAP
jgi:hypothetical protein